MNCRWCLFRYSAELIFSFENEKCMRMVQTSKSVKSIKWSVLSHIHLVSSVEATTFVSFMWILPERFYIYTRGLQKVYWKWTLSFNFIFHEHVKPLLTYKHLSDLYCYTKSDLEVGFFFPSNLFLRKLGWKVLFLIVVSFFLCI